MTPPEEVDGGVVYMSNLEKVLWHRVRVTKGVMLVYYAEVAPVLLPHLEGHPLTLRRFPDGVEGVQWYQTRAPGHPDWVSTVTMLTPRTGKTFEVCVVDDV